MQIPKSAKEEDIWHIVPGDDDLEHVHEDRGNCWCRPEIEEDGIGWLVIHNAADGRERYEQGIRKPH